MQRSRDIGPRAMDEATHMVFNVGKTFAKKARSAPAVQQYHSPMRQHKRTPSQHREIKVGKFHFLRWKSPLVAKSAGAQVSRILGG